MKRLNLPGFHWGEDEPLGYGLRDLRLTKLVYNALVSYNHISNLNALLSLSANELRSLRHIGEKSAKMIEVALSDRGLHLRKEAIDKIHGRVYKEGKDG